MGPAVTRVAPSTSAATASITSIPGTLTMAGAAKRAPSPARNPRRVGTMSLASLMLDVSAGLEWVPGASHEIRLQPLFARRLGFGADGTVGAPSIHVAGPVVLRPTIFVDAGFVASEGANFELGEPIA